MFADFINLCFGGLNTDIEKLFAMMIVLCLLSVTQEIIVACLEVGKR